MSIYGIGIDIVSIKRIKSSIKNKNFIKRIYNYQEILKCKKSFNQINCYAKRFAAKEAFSKAIGTGISNGIKFNEIVVTNNKFGKPYLNPNTLSISISNDQDLVAMIVNSEKCGIDIQTPKRKIFNIKKKFINKDDFSYDGNNEDLLWTWCAKESMYKILGIPEIFFKDHLKIKVINENTLYGECIHEKYFFSCQLNKLKINNHFLVYTSNFETN